jgi:hypothetical protein
VTSHRCVTQENALASSAVVFCECTIILIFSVLFCVVIAVHQCAIRLAINETPDKGRPVVVIMQ